MCAGTYPLRVSWADVWSVSTSTLMFLARSSGRISAAFACSATDRASFSSFAVWSTESASSSEVAIVSTYFVFRRFSILSRSASIARQAAPFIVAASGWAPPIPPRPAVTSSLPASDPPKYLSATAAKVS